MFFFKVLTLLLVIVVCCVAAASNNDNDNDNDRNFAEEYEMINEFLMSELRNVENPETNLQLAYDKHDTLYPDKSKSLSLFTSKKDIANKNYRKALESFIMLRHILKSKTRTYASDKCTKYDKLFMYKAAIATGAHRYSENPIHEFNRVGRIVNSISSEHAEICRTIWPAAFKYEYERLDKTMVKLAEGFKSKQLVKKPEMSDRQYMEWLIDHKPLSDPNDLIYAAQHIKKHAGFIPQGSKAKDVLENYLLKPCAQYVATIGAKALEQAEFDAEMFKGKDGYVLDDDGDGDSLVPFYKALVYFRYCRKIQNNEDFNAGVLAALKSV